MILATLCYIKKNNKILMLHRVKKETDFHEGKWNGVGGKLEIGETPEECAIREVKEETGLTVKSLKFKGILTAPKFDTKNDWYIFVFVVNKFKGKIIESSEGYLEWIENDKLLNLNLWPGDKLFIPWTFEEKFFSMKVIYKNKIFKNYSVTFYK